MLTPHDNSRLAHPKSTTIGPSPQSRSLPAEYRGASCTLQQNSHALHLHSSLTTSEPRRRQILPAHLFNDLSCQLNDIVVPNDGVTVGKYALAFDPGGMQSCLPLFRWRKIRHTKRVIIGLRRDAESGGNRESSCKQTRKPKGFPPNKGWLCAGGQGKKERAIH